MIHQSVLCTEAYTLLPILDKNAISYGDIWKHLLNHPGLERFHQCPEWEVLPHS